MLARDGRSASAGESGSKLARERERVVGWRR